MTELKTEGLTTYQIIEIFRKRIADISDRVAIMLWGLTGTGKSQLQRQILNILSNGKRPWTPKAGVTTTGALEVIGDWGLVDLRLSQLDPTDLRGLPNLNGKTVLWLPPEELPFVGQEHRFPSKGVLFLDEFTQAQPAMQSAGFSLVLDRRIGPHVLQPNWKIVAASNYSEENANTYQMGSARR
jgi:MoxR-like ATPase